MDLDSAIEFVTGLHSGVLATIKGDGRPQLSNVTYAVFPDRTIRISVAADKAKVANLRRDPRASLHVTPPEFRPWAVIEADATLLPRTTSPDDATADALVDLYRKLRGEHPDWDDFRAAMVDERRMMIVLTPTRAYGIPQ